MAADGSTSARYRSILPSTASSGRPGEGEASVAVRTPRKRKSVAAACDACRQRKAPCNGQVPCDTCSRRHIDCTYSKARGNSQRMIQLLRSMPYGDSVRLLRLLRESPESEPPLPSLPSYLNPSQFPSQNSLEFELNNRHPIAYPPLFPLKVATLPLSRLLRPTRLPKSVDQSEQEKTEQEHGASCDMPTAELGDGASESWPPSPPMAPGFMRPLIDNRLYSIDVSHWTRVPVSNALAIRALSLYFEIDHPTIPLFDADLFLEDLSRHKTRFCSQFLVNTLLAWSCLLYIPFDAQAAPLSVEFYQEAQSMAEQEAKRDNSISALAALHLLGLYATTYGQEKIGLRAMKQGIEMGRRMKLFGNASAGVMPPILQEAGGHASMLRAVSFTTWGVFNRLSLHCLHYQTTEVDIPNMVIPMPGALEPLPCHSTRTLPVVETRPLVFFASCQLWVIFHDVIQAYYGGRRDKDQWTELAETTYRRLLSWAVSLPLELARGDKVSHAGAIMHMYFHAIVTDIFRPFLQGPYASQRLSSFTSGQAIPEAIYAASVSQLKRLLLHFRQAHQPAAQCSVLWQTSIIYVSNAMVHEASTSPTLLSPGGLGAASEWRFYLELCLAGLEDLYGSFRMSRVAAEALMALALQKGALTYADARRVLLELDQIGRNHQPHCTGEGSSPWSNSSSSNSNDDGGEEDSEKQHVLEGAWVMDQMLAVEDREAAQVQRKADELQELMLLHEFTTGVAE